MSEREADVAQRVGYGLPLQQWPNTRSLKDLAHSVEASLPPHSSALSLNMRWAKVDLVELRLRLEEAASDVLETADLYGIGFDDVACLAIAQFIGASACSKLSSLDLGKNNISGVGVQTLDAALAASPSLRLLKLDFNRIDDSGCELVSALIRSGTCIRTLDLHANEFTGEGAVAITRGILFNNTLTRLDVSQNALGDGGVEAFAAVLRTNRSITALNLATTRMQSAGVRALCDMLESNVTLHELDLDQAVFDRQAVIKFCAVMRHNRSIKQLSLHAVRVPAVTDLGDMCEALANADLHDVTLSRIGLVDAIMSSVASLLTNPYLETLNLESNRISDLGMSQLMYQMRKNRGLLRLLLANNQINGKFYAADELRDYVLRNKRRKRLVIDLQRNPFLPSYYATVREVVNSEAHDVLVRFTVPEAASPSVPAPAPEPAAPDDAAESADAAADASPKPLRRASAPAVVPRRTAPPAVVVQPCLRRGSTLLPKSAATSSSPQRR